MRDSWLPAENLSLPGMNVTMYGAGHVAGAKMIGVSSEEKTILYTGDFCIHDTEILEGCNINALPREPDVLISESTYGGKIRPPRDELTKQFLDEAVGHYEAVGQHLDSHVRVSPESRDG